VLDFGTGTGIWAIDAADENPSALVIGTDLSPIQPTWVPPNCKFMVDDVETEWIYPPAEDFDFIHGRAMGGSIKDWKKLYRDIYSHLKPGAWAEIQEYETWIQNLDGTMDDANYLMEWQVRVNEASGIFGKKMNVARDHKQDMIDAGFVDVVDVIKQVFSYKRYTQLVD
jgi:trans-aconitate methyltransferase